MKRLIATALTLSLAASLIAGCSSTDESKAPGETAQETATITVGASVTPHSEILYQAQSILAAEGITLNVVEIEDVVTPNTGVAEGTLDANFFQHQPYLDDFNAENGTDLVSIGAVHYEPFGVYPGKTASLDELPEGAVVAVPNNVTNEARALLLLEQEGIIEVDDAAGILATVQDITSNPLNIEFVEVDPAQLVRTLPDVDIAVINGNYALEGGLSIQDAIAVEAADGLAAQTYKNIVVTTADKANDPALARLVEVLQSQEIQDYILNTYNGSVVPVQ